jgi:hypothetical protein
MTNLRKVLHALRSRTPALDGCVEITPRTVRWRPEVPTRLDVAAFEELLATGGAGRGAALGEAAALYGGDLLEGRADEWVLAERDRLRLRHLDALDELAGLHEAAGSSPRRSPSPSGSGARSPCGRRPTVGSCGCTPPGATGRGRWPCSTSAAPPWSGSSACPRRPRPAPPTRPCCRPSPRRRGPPRPRPRDRRRSSGAPTSAAA